MAAVRKMVRFSSFGRVPVAWAKARSEFEAAIKLVEKRDCDPAKVVFQRGRRRLIAANLAFDDQLRYLYGSRWKKANPSGDLIASRSYAEGAGGVAAHAVLMCSRRKRAWEREQTRKRR